MSTIPLLDEMLLLADEIRVLAASLMQLTPTPEQQNEFADQILQASQRLKNALVLGAGAGDLPTLGRFRFECNASLQIIEGYCDLYPAADAVPLPASHTNILQHILDNVAISRVLLNLLIEEYSQQL